jgi:hypothetical protein
MGEKEDIENMSEAIKSMFHPIKTLADAIGSMVAQSDELNRSFGLGRSRIVEMNVAIADSAAGITRLGGSLDDVGITISAIAEGSRRNVIENEKVVSTLYAASKVLEIDATRLVDVFASVGYETSQIGPNLGKSIEYIQSVGLNAKTVMKDVADNMGQMNRFQFTDGVVGLAKMAAQASMLRFDMRETFTLADKVLDPAGAIDVAAAFQRLGVSVGNLADPFQLMNQSINDPSGLQTSLVEVAKSFTYFDEKTKSFKINPQGVLTLREMGEQTGVSAKEMMKMGLAAADLEKRVSTVNAAGLKFGSEEDKQYLANIAKMGDKEYEVTLTDGTKKELQNLNQEEFDELIKQQKDAPKTVEDIARSQLDWTKVMAGDIEAMVNALKFGVASSKDVTTNIEGLRNISTKLTGAAQDNLPKSSEVRGLTEDALTKMKDLFDEKKSGKISSDDFNLKLKSLEDGLQNSVRNLGGTAMETFQTILKESAKNVKGDSFIENQFRSLVNMGTGEKMTNTSQQKPTIFTPITNNTTTKDAVNAYTRSGALAASSSSKTIKNINSSVDFGGTITIKVDAPAGVSDQQFKTYFESDEFKKKIYEYYNQKSKELGEKR